MAIDVTVTNRLRCDARTGEIAGEFGFVPTWCQTTIGIREIRDRAGYRRRYCAAPGHQEYVIARYGEAFDDETALFDAHESHAEMDPDCGKCVAAAERDYVERYVR